MKNKNQDFNWSKKALAVKIKVLSSSKKRYYIGGVKCDKAKFEAFIEGAIESKPFNVLGGTQRITYFN